MSAECPGVLVARPPALPGADCRHPAACAVHAAHAVVGGVLPPGREADRAGEQRAAATQISSSYHHAEHPLVAVVLDGGVPRPGPDEPLRQPLVVPLGVPRRPRRLVCQHLGPGPLPPPPQPWSRYRYIVGTIDSTRLVPLCRSWRPTCRP